MSLKHAILVLLEKEPGSGYDLVQRFNQGIGNFWNASHQQVYQQLKKLHADLEVEYDLAPQSGKPDRKVYRITSSGLQELKRWLAASNEPAVVRDALLIKVFAADLADQSSLRDEIDRHRQLHADKLAAHLAAEEKYLQQPAARQKAMRMPYMTLRLGIRYERQWLEWLEEVQALFP